MLESVTIAIAIGAYGLVAGAFLPGAVAASILYWRRHGAHLTTILKLFGWLFLAFVLFGFIALLMMEGAKLLGASGDLQSSLETNSLLVGNQIGFWGSVVALYRGFRRGRRDRGAMPTPG